MGGAGWLASHCAVPQSTRKSLVPQVSALLPRPRALASPADAGRRLPTRIVSLPPYGFTPFALSSLAISSDMSAPSDTRDTINCLPSGDQTTATNCPSVVDDVNFTCLPEPSAAKRNK